MSKKIALQGFDRVTFFPVLQNDSKGYRTGSSFPIPAAQEMSRNSDTGEQKFYADDGLYLHVKQHNAITADITVLEMPFDTLEKLGFGEYNSDTGEFIANPQGQSKSFAVTFRCLNAAGEYRMYKFYNYTVNEVKESSVKTKSGDVSLATYQICGSFTKRAFDTRYYAMKDADLTEMGWLDVVESEGSDA